MEVLQHRYGIWTEYEIQDNRVIFSEKKLPKFILWTIGVSVMLFFVLNLEVFNSIFPRSYSHNWLSTAVGIILILGVGSVLAKFIKSGNPKRTIIIYDGQTNLESSDKNPSLVIISATEIEKIICTENALRQVEDASLYQLYARLKSGQDLLLHQSHCLKAEKTKRLAQELATRWGIAVEYGNVPGLFRAFSK
jgi:hypothetical protein